MPTEILWTDETWNPIIGCSKVSAGCDNCYAEKMAWRLSNMESAKNCYREVEDFVENYGRVVYINGGWNGKTVFVESALEKPLHWRNPRNIFVCSMSDLFHPSVKFDWIDEIIKIIFACPQHTFQFLTKRPEIMAKYIDDTFVTGKRIPHGLYADRMRIPKFLINHPNGQPPYRIPPNLWLGVTAENQEMWDIRVGILKQIPAALRFGSVEPMLGPIDATKDLLPGFKDIEGLYTDNLPPEPNLLDWVIIGAESGPKRRKCEWKWADDLTRQCQQAEVPVFVKQIHHIDSLELIKAPSGWPREMPKVN